MMIKYELVCSEKRVIFSMCKPNAYSKISGKEGVRDVCVCGKQCRYDNYTWK